MNICTLLSNNIHLEYIVSRDTALSKSQRQNSSLLFLFGELTLLGAGDREEQRHRCTRVQEAGGGGRALTPSVHVP